MAANHQVSASDGAALVGDVLTRIGFVVVTDALAPMLRAALLSDLNPLLARADPNDPAIAALGESATTRYGMADGVFMAGQTRRVMGLVAKSSAYRDLIVHPLLVDVCSLVLGSACDAVQVHSTSTMSVGPGAPMVRMLSLARLVKPLWGNGEGFGLTRETAALMPKRKLYRRAMWAS